MTIDRNLRVRLARFLIVKEFVVTGPGILHISDFVDRDDQWNDVHVAEIAVHELSNQSAIIHFTHVSTRFPRQQHDSSASPISGFSASRFVFLFELPRQSKQPVSLFLIDEVVEPSSMSSRLASPSPTSLRNLSIRRGIYV
jgi:hypothetical protein